MALLTYTGALLLSLLYLIYWIPKHLGYRKIGVLCSATLVVSALAHIILFVFSNVLFSKSDAGRMLAGHGFGLSAGFEILSNEESGIGDYSQRFELKISAEDKSRLERLIMTSQNYRGYIGNGFQIRSTLPRYAEGDTIFMAGYQDSLHYVCEFYQPHEKGFKPVWDKISIPKRGNKLIYERVLD